MLCHECKIEQPIESFSFKDKKKGKRQLECKTCHNHHSRNYYHKHRTKHLQEVKVRRHKYYKEMRELIISYKDKPCIDCLNSYPHYVMDFDHLDDKKYVISEMPRRGFSKEMILKEISKCEVVCSNCHRIRTFNRKPKLEANL